MSSLVYGGFDLRIGDRDRESGVSGSKHRYGGKDVDPTQLPHPDPGHVKRLQMDLKTFGFAIVGEPDGVFGTKTEFAVREFQVYARLRQVAYQTSIYDPDTIYADTLVSKSNQNPYTGPVTGSANAETRARLELWGDMKYRCPVVIEAWRIHGGQMVECIEQNLWHSKDLRDSKLRMFARDFSGRYGGTWPPVPDGKNDRAVVGEYTGSKTSRYVGGPISMAPRHVWPSAEILPGNIVGKAWADMSAAERSTFRVIRTISEAEASGYFDSVNAWDTAVLSLGCYHHTILLLAYNKEKKKWILDKGEFGANLVYIKKKFPGAYERFAAQCGIHVDEDWDRDRTKIYVKGLRKYEAWVRVKDQDDNWIDTKDLKYAEYFRSWHWFYRAQMAMRTDADLQKSFWLMTRIRIRDVLDTPWPKDDKFELRFNKGSVDRAATIGDVFKSELATALIMRWHVNRPAPVVSKGGTFLKKILTIAKITEKNTAKWTDKDETKLISAIIKLLETDRRAGPIQLFKDFTKIDGWPSTLGSLHGSKGRSALRHNVDKNGMAPLGRQRIGNGAFQLDTEGL
ncbi:peptidoglycan-binding domain-containing protein [Rheinheimera gaetbuli]